MNHPKRGRAVIFNFEKFDNFEEKLEKREGSAVDVEKLEDTFTEMGFDVKVHQNLSHKDIVNELAILSQEDHTDSDCLVITILTHGLDHDYLAAKDRYIKFNNFWQPFTNDKCLSLAGKPKIFIIQACRGDTADSGVALVRRRLSMTDSTSNSYKIPTMADFLFAFSTPPGFFAWRTSKDGSWFIQSLCQVLKKNYKEQDLLKMLTRVAHKVATTFVSTDPYKREDFHEKLQVPNVYSTLIRDIYFN